MNFPDLSPAFPFATPITNYRNSPGHIQLCDREFFDSCGYATADEARILYETAQKYGGEWLEIGTHTGWTAAHIIAGGAKQFTGLDPEFGHPQYNKTMDPFRFLKRAAENIKRANPGRLEGLEAMFDQGPVKGFYLDRVGLYGEKSWDLLPELSANWMNDSQSDRSKVEFDFVFIDGEHEPPFPAVDAMLVYPMLKPDCAVFFHDGIGGPVRAGAEWLRRQGFQVKYYKTAQILGVAWRGNIEPPDFEPAPSGFDWKSYMNHLHNCPQAQIDAWIVKAEEFLKSRS